MSGSIRHQGFQCRVNRCVVNKFPYVSAWGFFCVVNLRGEISEDFGDYGGSSQGISEDFGKISGLREVQMGLFRGVLGGKRGLFHVFLRFFTLFLSFFGFFRKKVKNYLVMCTKPCIFISSNKHTNLKNLEP